MPKPQFIQNYTQVIAGILLCIEQRLHAPALILIYSTMDSYAWAISEKGNGSVRSRFETFAANYVLTKHSLPCSPTDLYAARCAILHTLTGDSDLSKRGDAKTLVYAWGDAETASLATVTDQIGMHKIITIHIEDLANSLFDAIIAVHEKAELDAVVKQRLVAAAGRHYKNMEKRSVEEFLQQLANKPRPNQAN